VTKVRPGDIVLFKAKVTRTADYDGGQQIMAKILPNGDEIGWCLPKENAFIISELTLQVGDQVKITDRPGHTTPWEIRALFDTGQAAIQQGAQPIIMEQLKNLRRV